WEKMMVGEVTEVNPHPDADRLKLATVNLGAQQLTVVCAAPNIAVGQRVPFARVGAQLIDGHTGEKLTLKPAKIRGILSEGMVCSEKELGISDSHEGIMVLPSEAPVGIPLGEYLGDTIFDLDVTPNRPDCLCLMGIAREVAALTGEEVHLPEIDYQEEEQSIDSLISVDITAPELCPRYCASLVTGITISSSPVWLQQRLRSYGMRPINNVVDITNYVMLEYGQPLHAFDYHKLGGHKIIVRRAKNGETITSLDEEGRTLNNDILVIADKEKPVAIAGIMGGLGSEVSDETTAILLESANFDHATIRRGARHFQLTSEASLRFEKRLSRELPLVALKRATRLFHELAHGKVAKGVVDVYPGKVKPEGILISAEEVKRLSGLDVNIDEIVRVLTSLGFECRQTSVPSQALIFGPYWRSDINCAADLVEEVIRIIGYDKIPATMLSATLPEREPRPRLELRKKIRGIMVGLGFQEVLTYSLTSLEKLRKLSIELEPEALKVANPMTREQEYLRPNLRAGLIVALAQNQKVEPGGIRLFEIGKVFLPKGDELPQEKEMLCAMLSGAKSDLSWKGEKGEFDFFDAKGMAENLLRGLGLIAEFKPGSDQNLSPAESAEIISEGDRIGVLGILHPKMTQAFELDGVVYLIEIDVEKLLIMSSGQKRYIPIYRFPAVSRDIALIVDEQTSYQQVESIIRSFPLVTEVTLFDFYTGEQIPQGKKSFAIRVVYQSPDHTLTDEEVNQIQQDMLDKLNQELGGSLRS
ncbi:MAG: phenylalanine--tRNA ligase subunit beta, partial [Dehalococcoidales bacterium]|nr:phenylalanine--tRNA ligase subunit beta [Dehalococcoidales bacterium]